MTAAFEWCGAVWELGAKEGKMYRCTVVQVVVAAAGWKVGDHCLLEEQELHPAATNKEST